MPRVIACLLRHLPLLQVSLAIITIVVIVVVIVIVIVISSITILNNFTIAIMQLSEGCQNYYHNHHQYHHHHHHIPHHHDDYDDEKVVDLANLHPGIEHYYRGTSNSKSSCQWHQE